MLGNQVAAYDPLLHVSMQYADVLTIGQVQTHKNVIKKKMLTMNVHYVYNDKIKKMYKY